jgi:hypothetical protein
MIFEVCVENPHYGLDQKIYDFFQGQEREKKHQAGERVIDKQFTKEELNHLYLIYNLDQDHLLEVYGEQVFSWKNWRCMLDQKEATQKVMKKVTYCRGSYPYPIRIPHIMDYFIAEGVRAQA